MGSPTSQRPTAALPWLPAALRPVGLGLTGAGGAFGYAVLARGFRPRLLDLRVFAVHARYFESKSFAVIEKNVSLEVAALLVFAGLFFMAFARDAVETEQGERTRLWALAWAACLGAALLLVATLTLFGLGFVYALAAHAIVTLALASGLAAAARARDALARRRGLAMNRGVSPQGRTKVARHEPAVSPAGANEGRWRARAEGEVSP